MMEDKITQWVKDNIFGMAESSIDESVIVIYSNYLYQMHYDYFTDLVNECIEKVGAFEIFEDIATTLLNTVTIREQKKFTHKVFLADLIKRIHDIEEQEESEEEDNGIDNSQRLMGEHRG